jgi:uncharacterized protein
MTKNGFDPISILARETEVPTRSVSATVRLLDEGNTVPFIARYRKEMTGELDEVKIRDIQERHTYLMELDARRQTILKSIEEQGKLTEDLKKKIEACFNKSELEDLYLPYRPKRRTRATIAKERGLETLSNRIRELPDAGNPVEEAKSFIDLEKQVPDEDTALAGARDIVAEWIAENADVRSYLRKDLLEKGILNSEAIPDKTEQRTKFEQYYEFKEPVKNVPSHRFLAIRRGEREGVLKVWIDAASETAALTRIGSLVGYREASPYAEHFWSALYDAYRRLLLPGVETEVTNDLKTTADRSAVDVFALNLKNLLLASPLGEHRVIGIDPGLRTGCKCVSVDSTGKLLEHETIYPFKGDSARATAQKEFVGLVERARPYAIAIGNGTGGRETESFVQQALREAGKDHVIVVSVNESGASVYSASDVARQEFPDLDLTIRGAVSIARRLQDPLAELVKIDPKSIGVGQYQHDVHQPLLQHKLDVVVEDCVNRVGVELNTASASLLSYVAGIGPKTGRSIVRHREEKGAFSARAGLLEVAGLGPKTYEQAAGFIRVRGGEHPLDGSAVHPERYELVERMARDLKVDVRELVGNSECVKKIDTSRYIGGDVGEPTLRDIVTELQKPGRDPRATFEPPRFREDVTTMEDLREGMELEGVVTNVTAFGAFIDIGVHQDGLVHISELAEHFVEDPHREVRVGERVKVRVLNVDLERSRIALSARSGKEKPRPPQKKKRPQESKKNNKFSGQIRWKQ